MHPVAPKRRSLRTPRPFFLRPLALSTVAVAALILTACGGQPGQGGPGNGGGGQDGPPPAKVSLGDATTQNVQNRWPVIGRLQEVRRTVVSAEQSGRIEEVLIEEGQRVTGGDDPTLLARLDDTFVQLRVSELQAEKVEAEAAVAQTRARVTEAEAAIEAAAARERQARSEYDYLRELLESNSARPKEVDDAKAAWEAAAASLRAAEAAAQAQRKAVESALAMVNTTTARLDSVRKQVERMDIYAPFDGEVVTKFAETGQWASPGTQIAEIVSTGSIDAVLQVPEQYINFVNVGDEVEVHIDPLRTHVTGTLIAKVPAGDNAARTFPVKVRLPDRTEVTVPTTGQRQEKLLLPGMSVSAHIPTGERIDALTVPRDAIQRSEFGEWVWVAAKNPTPPAGGQSGQPGPPSPAPDAGAEKPSEGKPSGAPGDGGQAGPPSDLVAMKVAVKVLFGIEDRFAVRPLPEKHPLRPGAKVVVEGAEGIFMPMQPLIPTQGGAPDKGDIVVAPDDEETDQPS